MTRTEFIENLKQRLSRLPAGEINKAISFYSENIDDKIESGMSEDEAVKSLEIDKIVSELLVDTPLTTLIQNKIKDSYRKSDNKKLWLVLAICGFPLWFPLCITAAALVFAAFVVFLALAFSFVVMSVSFAIAGFFGIFYGIYICFAVNAPSGLFIIGCCLALFGLSLALIRPLFWLCKNFVKIMLGMFRQIKRLFVPKKKEEIK